MASIGPVGNAIFVNQMTPAATSMPNAHNNRIEFQNMVAQAAVQEQKKEIEELRPAEENHAVDPDREHTKEEADQEQKRRQKRTPKEPQNDDEESPQATHKLDIKV